MASPDKIQELKDIANKLRIHSVVQTTAANSGYVLILQKVVMHSAYVCFCSHPTSCASAAEVMSVLFFHVMKYTGMCVFEERVWFCPIVKFAALY